MIIILGRTLKRTHILALYFWWEGAESNKAHEAMLPINVALYYNTKISS